MKEITVSAPGKVHLTSAHIVVYGKPALLCAINLRVTVSIKNENHQGKIIISSNIFKDALTLENKKIKTFTAQAKKSWEEYGKTNNIELIKPLTEPAGFVKIIIGETLAYLKKDLKDVEININSQVPLGANFGGSASVSAALFGLG
ncbi:MAG: hypothetical protein M1120_00185, partial [Patescibacteria group bacterium]|nr:hypothetical protein [Patescibacteria group bacterium]